MIAVIDYGVGNLFSLSSSLAYLGLENKITRSARELDEASHIILPGSARSATRWKSSRPRALCPSLSGRRKNGKPLLGICLACSFCLKKSYEYGEHAGLGMLPGSVCPLEPDLAAAGFELQGAAHRLEQPASGKAGKPADGQYARGRFRLFRPFVLCQGLRGRAGGRRRIRRDGAQRGGAGQCVRLPVSPGKKAEKPACASCGLLRRCDGEKYRNRPAGGMRAAGAQKGRSGHADIPGD